MNPESEYPELSTMKAGEVFVEVLTYGLTIKKLHR